MTTLRRTADRSPASPGDADFEQHSTPTSIALHLLPGVLLAALFYLTGPLALTAGYPAIAAGIVCGAVVLVGGELGWLLHEGHRRTGSWSVAGALPFRPGSFTWRKALLTLGLFAGAFAASIVLGSISGSFKDEFFTWLPEWALNPLPASFLDTGTQTAHVATALGYLVFLVILGPLAEELYFRGYLLPRISRFGAWAPLMNASLFALYHLWKPWDVLTVLAVLGPATYAVWKLKDIRISIAVHVAINATGWLLNIAPSLLFD
jgi:membrane protease YdiL (CAAX protease family)